VLLRISRAACAAASWYATVVVARDHVQHLLAHLTVKPLLSRAPTPLLLQEDLWTEVVKDLVDYSPNSTRGEVARKRGVARSSREMLEQLCKAESVMFAHLPNMFNVHECHDGHTLDGRLCTPDVLQSLSTKAPKRRWFILRSEDGPVDEEGRLPEATEKAAYATVCAQELLPAEPEITEAISARFSGQKKLLNKVEAAIVEMNATDKYDQAREHVLKVLGECSPTSLMDEGLAKLPEECEEKLEDGHDRLEQVNITKQKAEKKFKKTMEKVGGILTQGRAQIGAEACVEVCRAEKNAKKKAKKKRKKEKAKAKAWKSLSCLDACVADDYDGNVVECIQACKSGKA
jgi:hypothetical protein